MKILTNLSKKSFNKNLLLTSLFISIIILSIFYIDFPINYFISEYINKNTIKTFKFITNLGSFEFIVCLNLYLILFSFGKFKLSKIKKIKDKYEQLTKLFILSFITEGIIAVFIQLLKFVFGRARPYIYHTNNLSSQFTFFNFNHDYTSFPSGHSAGVWVFITCISIIFKKNKYSKLLLTYGIIISCSRIILSQHYLSDVLFSAILGIFLTKTIITRLIHSDLKDYYFKKYLK